MMASMRSLLAMLPLLAAPGLAQTHDSPAFEDASAELGVLFQDFGGSWGMQMGGGMAWFDCDGDGDDDLFLAASNGQNRLFEATPAAFVDRTAGAGVETLGNFDPVAVAPADYDDDGAVDLYVLTTAKNVLLRNDGDGTFTDVTAAEGVAGGFAWSEAGSWADFDLDGDLDLYVGNYVRTVSFPYHDGEPNLFFESLHAGGPGGFVERAAELGVDCTGVFGPSDPKFPQFVSPEGAPAQGLTLSVCSLDFDEDGDPDLHVGNDFGMWVLPNALYRNDTASGTLAFQDVAAATGFDQRPQYNMGISPADFDHDGDWDYYLSNLGANVMLRNDGGVFTDVTREVGAAEAKNPDGTQLYSTWATIWADFDNDTWQDLFVVNGFVPASLFLDNDPREANALYRNREGQELRRFGDAVSGIADEGPGRGAAWTDVDGDGRIDVYTTNNLQVAVALPQDASRLWRNALPSSNHWLELRLRGTASNREGVGARVEAELPSGVVLKRQVLADTVFLCSSSRMVHLGLGGATTVDLTVRWPSGTVQVLSDVPADQRMLIVEPNP